MTRFRTVVTYWPPQRGGLKLFSSVDWPVGYMGAVIDERTIAFPLSVDIEVGGFLNVGETNVEDPVMCLSAMQIRELSELTDLRSLSVVKVAICEECQHGECTLSPLQASSA